MVLLLWGTFLVTMPHEATIVTTAMSKVIVSRVIETPQMVTVVMTAVRIAQGSKVWHWRLCD